MLGHSRAEIPMADRWPLPMALYDRYLNPAVRTNASRPASCGSRCYRVSILFRFATARVRVTEVELDTCFALMRGRDDQ